MGTVGGVVIAAIVGAIIAVGGVVGAVSVIESRQVPPVDAQLTVYGGR